MWNKIKQSTVTQSKCFFFTIGSHLKFKTRKGIENALSLSVPVRKRLLDFVKMLVSSFDLNDILQYTAQPVLKSPVIENQLWYKTLFCLFKGVI